MNKLSRTQALQALRQRGFDSVATYIEQLEQKEVEQLNAILEVNKLLKAALEREKQFVKQIATLSERVLSFEDQASVQSDQSQVLS